MENIEIQTLTGLQNLYKYPGIEVINNFLNVGEKLMITGTRLSCKSFAALQLAVAVAEGWDWLDFDVVKGKVLYVNLGMNDMTCMYRVNEIYKSYGLNDSENINNIHFLNLKGKANFTNVDALVDFLIESRSTERYKMIIIDSLDDSFNLEWGQTLNNGLNRLLVALGTSIAFTCSRNVGFGKVFFESLYDAVVDFNYIEKEIVEDKENTLWEVSYRTRNFPFKQNDFFRFDFPTHEIDDSIFETKEKIKEKKKENWVKGTQKANKKKSNKSRRELEKAFDELSENDEPINVYEIAEHLNVVRQTIYKKVKKHEDFIVVDGMVQKIKKDVSQPIEECDKDN